MALITAECQAYSHGSLEWAEVCSRESVQGWCVYEPFQAKKPDLVILCRWIMSSDKKEFTLLYTYNLI